MTDILVDDIDEKVVEMLRAMAQRNGRSLEDEVKVILEKVVAKRERSRRLPPDLAKLQAELARHPSSDSTDIVRGMRDGR